MRVVALISGGKDSTFNMMQCIAAGHQIVALANLSPHSRTEIDSFMYQSVGHEAIELIAAAMDLPLYRKETMGVCNETGKNYEPSKNDEVEDLFLLLEQIKNEIDIEAVSVGAILSDYQRIRVENVCIRLGLIPLAYLWQRNQGQLLDEMIKCEVDAIIIKVACLGLEIKHLGRSLSLMQPHLLAMHEKYGLHICGEGGEYETLTLDCPLFKSRLVIQNSEVVIHSEDTIAPVGYLVFRKLGLELKLPALDLFERLVGLPLKDCDGYLSDQSETEIELDESKSKSENLLCGSVVDIFSPNLVQRTTSVKSKYGWLWIGGIQGYNTNDPVEAMKQAMSILKCYLDRNDHDIKDVCSVTMFINDMSRFGDLNIIYKETFNYSNPPTRACVQVPFHQNSPVRIEVLSWKRTTSPIERQTMHVQSRSHWAPANIGPYSQSVRIQNLIHLAGQIGLVPGSMEIVKGGIRAECQLALQHLNRVLKAIDSNFNLRNVVQGICFVTDIAYVQPAKKMWEERTNNAIVDYMVVTALPRNSLVEWHVWAHKYNNQFDYEERGKCIDNYLISIYRRWNYENNISAILCHVDHVDEEIAFDNYIFKEAMDYTIQKLRQGCEDNTSAVNFKVFYSLIKSIDIGIFTEYFESKVGEISYTLVPVVMLKSTQTFLSICGVRIP